MFPAALYTSYHSWRVNTIEDACAISSIRCGVIVPAITCMFAYLDTQKKPPTHLRKGVFVYHDLPFDLKLSMYRFIYQSIV